MIVVEDLPEIIEEPPKIENTILHRVENGTLNFLKLSK